MILCGRCFMMRKKNVVSLVFLIVCAFALYMPDRTAQGVKAGMDSSLNILLPSLFPFMFLSSFAVEYDISEQIGKRLSWLSEFLFYLPREATVTIILSLVGGYPVGAVGINSLLKKGYITTDQAVRMLCFCVNPGPAFMIGIVGDCFFGSRKIGMILFASQTVASIIVGIITGFWARFSKDSRVSYKKYQPKPLNRDFSTAFVISTKNACNSAVSMCSAVIIFSAFTSLLEFSAESQSGIFLRTLLEITDGCSCIINTRYPLYFTALAIGWGGISVHFQVFASVPNLQINKLKFCFARISVGAISALIIYFIDMFVDIPSEVFADISQNQVKFTSGSALGSGALFVSSILFLIFTKKSEKSINKTEFSEYVYLYN